MSDTETVLRPATRAVCARALFTHHGRERLGFLPESRHGETGNDLGDSSARRLSLLGAQKLIRVAKIGDRGS